MSPFHFTQLLQRYKPSAPKTDGTYLPVNLFSQTLTIQSAAPSPAKQQNSGLQSLSRGSGNIVHLCNNNNNNDDNNSNGG